MKFRKRKIAVVVMSILSIVLGGSGMTMYAFNTAAVKNHFETGVTDISIHEYQMKSEERTDYEPAKLILPGQNISKIPSIKAEGSDCYIRAKITFRETTAENMEEGVYGISDDWVKRGDGYYYYTKVLKTGEAVDFFQGIIIPSDFSQEDHEGKSTFLDVDVDAIQAKNFVPDFEGDFPWGQIEILKCEKEGQYDVTSFREADNKSFEVQYQGDALKLVTNEKDFFANFPTLMPGDEYEDTVNLVNSDKKHDVKFYFRSDIYRYSKLYDKINIVITSNVGGTEKEIYNGTLRESKLRDKILLGTIPAGKSADFNFKISVPAELNNEYSLEAGDIRWIFSTEPIIKDEPAKAVKRVQTGDDDTMAFVLMGAGVLFLVGAVLLRKGEEV